MRRPPRRLHRRPGSDGDDSSPADQSDGSDENASDESESTGPEHPDFGEDAVAWREPDVEATFALRDGVLYARPSPTWETCVAGLDADSGERTWGSSVTTGAAVCSEPVVADGVFVSHSNDVSRGGVRALDRDGTRRWDVSIWSVHSPPRVHDDTVYVATDEGAVHALDATDGAERWQREPGDVGDDDGSWEDWSVRGVDDDAIVLGGGDLSTGETRLFGLDPADGATEWTYDVGSPIADVLRDGDTFVASEERTVRLSDGSEEWSVEVGTAGGFHGLLDGVLVASDEGRGGGAVLGLDVEDGSTVWQVEAGTPAVAVGDGEVLVGTTALERRALDGEVRERVELDGTDVRAVAAAGDIVYAATYDAVYRIGPDEVRSTSAVSGVQRLLAGEERVFAWDGDETAALEL